MYQFTYNFTSFKEVSEVLKIRYSKFPYVLTLLPLFVLICTIVKNLLQYIVKKDFSFSGIKHILITSPIGFNLALINVQATLKQR